MRSKQGAQRAAYHLKANVGAAPVEDLTARKSRPDARPESLLRARADAIGV